MKKVLSVVLVLSIVVAFTMVTTKAYAANLIRLSGEDRYETGVKIVQENWTTSDNVILSTGAGDDTFADALAGTPLAYVLNAPVLLSNKDSIPIPVLNQIKNLKAKNIYILGGTGVVSRNVQDSLIKNGYNVTRLSGLDRYGTAVQIGEFLRKQRSITKVFITTGYEFQYALAISPYAAQQDALLLFTDGNTLNPTTKNALQRWGIKNVEIVGGIKIVPLSVENELKNMGIAVSRIQGDTPSDIVVNVIDKYGNGTTGITVANIDVYADSLSGAIVAAKKNYPVVLVKKGAIDSKVLMKINALKPEAVYIFGGPGAVSSAVENTLRNIPKATDDKPVPAQPVPTTPSVPSTPVKTTVTIADPSVESIIRQVIEKPIGDITMDDVQKVTRLSLRDPSITNLDGLQYFTNLSFLDLNDTGITDITPITGLKNLTQIEMEDTKITSLKGISNLTNLKSLDVIDNRISDISELSKLKNLEELYLSGTDVSDLSPLAALTNLKKLVIMGCPVTDGTPISKLPRLEVLYASMTGIRDLRFISNLITLKEIRLELNRITDISPLKSLDNVSVLCMGGNEITDISPLLEMDGLKYVEIGGFYDNESPEIQQIVQTLRARGVEIPVY